MLLTMSDQFPDHRADRSDLRHRLLSNSEREQQEIQDFLNAKGGIYVALIVAVIVVTLIIRTVLG